MLLNKEYYIGDEDVILMSWGAHLVQRHGTWDSKSRDEIDI